MNTEHKPQAGDVWEYCGLKHNIIGRDGDKVWAKSTTDQDTWYHTRDLGSFGHPPTKSRLIERDGKRGEDLWQEWPWEDCPEYRREQICKAWEDGYVVEVPLYPGHVVEVPPGSKEWRPVDRAKGKSFLAGVVGSARYRITDRKREPTPGPQQLPALQGFEFREIYSDNLNRLMIDLDGRAVATATICQHSRFVGFYYESRVHGRIMKESLMYVIKNEPCNWITTDQLEEVEILRPTYVVFKKVEIAEK